MPVFDRMCPVTVMCGSEAKRYGAARWAAFLGISSVMCGCLSTLEAYVADFMMEVSCTRK
jgi:hypothetical protein